MAGLLNLKEAKRAIMAIIDTPAQNPYSGRINNAALAILTRLAIITLIMTPFSTVNSDTFALRARDY